MINERGKKIGSRKRQIKPNKRSKRR